MKSVSALVCAGNLVALALALASPAIASGSTALCATSEDPCSANQLTSIHFANTPATTVLMRNSTTQVSCAGFSLTAKVSALGSPQGLKATEMTFSKCSAEKGAAPCTAVVEELPSYDLTNTGGDTGTLTALSGSIHLKCAWSGFTLIDCTYATAESQFAMAGGKSGAMLTANDQPLSVEKGAGLACPQALPAMLEFLAETPEEAHIAS